MNPNKRNLRNLIKKHPVYFFTAIVMLIFIPLFGYPVGRRGSPSQPFLHQSESIAAVGRTEGNRNHMCSSSPISFSDSKIPGANTSSLISEENSQITIPDSTSGERNSVPFGGNTNKGFSKVSAQNSGNLKYINKQKNSLVKDSSLYVGVGPCVHLHNTIETSGPELSNTQLRMKTCLEELLQHDFNLFENNFEIFELFVKNSGRSFLNQLNNTVGLLLNSGKSFAYTSSQQVQGNESLSGISIVGHGENQAITKQHLANLCRMAATEVASINAEPERFANITQRFLTYYQKASALLVQEGQNVAVYELRLLQKEAQEVLERLTNVNFFHTPLFYSAKLSSTTTIHPLDLQFYLKSFTPLQINPAFSINCVTKDFCVGIGKAKIYHFGDSRIGLLTGIDWSAQYKYGSKYQFNGFGMRFFLGIGSSF